MEAFKPLRVFFSKTGPARYISHLDLMRAMTRALRRAGLPIWYTEGFNRHPYLTFAAPLSLGHEGLCESMDIRLVEPVEPEEAAARLGAVMPEGIIVLRAAEPVMKPGVIARAAYRLEFTGGSRLEEFLAQPSIPVSKRTKKGGEKEVDIRPHMTDIHVERTADGETLRVTLPAGSEFNLNPSLAADAYRAFAGDGEIGCRVVRTALLGKQGEVFA